MSGLNASVCSTVARAVLGACRPSHVSREDARSDGTSTAAPMDTARLLGQPAASHAKQGAEALPAPSATPASLPSVAPAPGSRSGTPGKGSGAPAPLGQPSTKRKLPLVRPPPCGILPYRSAAHRARALVKQCCDWQTLHHCMEGRAERLCSASLSGLAYVTQETGASWSAAAGVP